ncbi:hypothetical protein WAX88_16245 [Photobacterium damselae subsp. damselae]|uniref:hypothetical protein n=1 Tax=Photobacterium damselae TaxID=38293 RepID=UPI00311B1724
MRVINNDSKIEFKGLPEQSPELVCEYLETLKEKLDIGWIPLCAVFGMEPTRGNSSNMLKWRKGIAKMPHNHWIFLLALTGKIEIESL